MTNEKRAEKLIQELGFNFDNISKSNIIELLESEINNFQDGSSEYIRLLCGYLYCLGDISDIPLIKKAKYGINMDVGCMIDSEWLTSLENGGIEDSFTRSRVDLIRDFIDYYSNYSADDDF